MIDTTTFAIFVKRSVSELIIRCNEWELQVPGTFNNSKALDGHR